MITSHDHVLLSAITVKDFSPCIVVKIKTLVTSSSFHHCFFLCLRNSTHQHILREAFLFAPFVCHTLNDYYVKRPINNTPSERFEWVKCGKYWEENPIMCEAQEKKIFFLEAEGKKKKQLVLLCGVDPFIFTAAILLKLFFFRFPYEVCVIYENAKCSFVRVIINCCVVNYNLELREKLKTEGNGKKDLLFIVLHSP